MGVCEAKCSQTLCVGVRAVLSHSERVCVPDVSLENAVKKHGQCHLHLDAARQNSTFGLPGWGWPFGGKIG